MRSMLLVAVHKPHINKFMRQKFSTTIQNSCKKIYLLMQAWSHWNTVNNFYLSTSIASFTTVWDKTECMRNTIYNDSAVSYWRRMKNSPIALLDVPMIAWTTSTYYHCLFFPFKCTWNYWIYSSVCIQWHPSPWNQHEVVDVDRQTHMLDSVSVHSFVRSFAWAFRSLILSSVDSLLVKCVVCNNHGAAVIFMCTW